jgi:uncharacterized membrane protein YphA (DoxX/SURF4 family)
VIEEESSAPSRKAWKAARFVLGVILCAAGFMKVAFAWEFSEAIANYRLLPPVANQLLGVVLPWWEVGTGLLLVLGLWVRASSLLSALLFAGFASAITAALLRGLDIDCGCFGSGLSGRIGLRTLIVDLMGLALSIMVFGWGAKERAQDYPAASHEPATAAARMER